MDYLKEAKGRISKEYEELKVQKVMVLLREREETRASLERINRDIKDVCENNPPINMRLD